MATDVAQIESGQMERYTANLPKPESGGRVGSRVEVASLVSQNQWVVLAKNSELDFASTDYSSQRNNLRSSLETSGILLPPENEFSQLVLKASEKLGVPEQTELMIVDTEEANAYFDPSSRTIVFTRGLARYFVERGLQLSEDHIAAILAHELEHAQVLGEDYVAKSQGSFLDRLQSSQHHAEEYRADAQAMRRLSKAKYNPRALIDVLRAMPLTTGRNQLSHPEQIDRIRKLEDRLADDEHPLSNTTKPLTPLEETTMEWICQDSSVYSEVEKLLHSSSDELTRSLQDVETQQEFWNIIHLKNNIDKIAAVKVLVGQENEKLERLAVKLLVLEAFCGKKPFADGQRAEVDFRLNNELAGVSYEESRQLHDVIYSFRDSDTLTSLFQGSVFRQLIPQVLPGNISIQTAPAEIDTLERLVDQAIRGRLGFLETKTLSEDEQKFFGQLRRCFETDQVSQDLLLTMYSSLDLQYQTGLQLASNEISQSRGVRELELNTGDLIDLRNPQKRNEVVEQIKFAIANKLVKKPEASDETISKLGLTIIHDTGLNEQEAAILAQTILKYEDAASWVTYLQTQDKNSLHRIIQQIKDLQERYSNLHFSPLRSLHRSYRSAASQVDFTEGFKPFADGADYGVDTFGIQAIRMFAAREFYLRGYPPGFQYTFENRLPPAQINLTMEEWDIAVEGDATHGIYWERAEWALMKYLEQVKEEGQPDPKLVEYAREHANVVRDRTDLTPEQIDLIIDHSIWDNTKLQLMLDSAFDNWFEAKKFPHGRLFANDTAELPLLSEQDRQQLLIVLKKTYLHFKNNPIDKHQVPQHQVIPRPEKIASLYLDVLIQDLEQQGLPTKDASVQAIKQALSEGVLLDYLSFSKEVVEHIGDFADKDIQEIIQILKNMDSVDPNKQNLIESFQLLELVSVEDRKEAAKKPICETSMKAILSRYGNESISWVMQNFDQSDLRDIILIGLYHFATEEQKQQFGVELIDKLTQNPDQYKAKRSSYFPFESYHVEVKLEEEPPDKFHGQGKVAENFPDLLKRRHPFATVSISPAGADFVIYNSISRGDERWGSIYQFFIARRLLKNESTIFDRNSPFDQRVQSLTEAAPYQSVVRDIHLEMLLQEELANTPDVSEQVRIGRVLLPLFTEKSSLKGPLATQVFRAELATHPQLSSNFNSFMQTLEVYMPQPSLARNYFLSQFENNARLTVEQLRQVSALRFSSEGKKSENDNAPMTYVFNKLAELNREEKVKTVLWLLGLSSEKPLSIRAIEHETDGHLNNLPGAVTTRTADEKEVLFMRFLLGAEGIVDLEAVRPDQFTEAQTQRRELITTLAINMLPDSMPQAGLFRNIFTTIIESSDPAHASRILTKLINKFTDAKIQGRQLPPEEVVALGLSELGVVGKKVAQGLAELDWVPNSYKAALRKSQSEGEIVSKRALLDIAEDAGLLEENVPMRIVSIDKFAGAASNKQAAFVTMQVNDESVGLPKGVHQVIGKFKRPSAQKIENIRHDLRVLENIMDVLAQEGYGESLPRDFLPQINDAVTKELDFLREKQFSEEMRLDLIRRNMGRKYKVNIPTIYFAGEDLMVESQALGMSLRNYLDLRQSNPEQILESGYGALQEREINQTLVTEAFAQLINTGNVHSDLHPGNIFVDQQGNITLIDLGMHQRLTSEQRFATISVIAGLASGNESYLKKTLKDLGWELGEGTLGLTRFNFADNVSKLVRASQRAASSPPEILTSVILATSKLSSYTAGFSSRELFSMLVGALNKREVPRVITHLVRSDLGTFLR